MTPPTDRPKPTASPVAVAMFAAFFTGLTAWAVYELRDTRAAIPVGLFGALLVALTTRAAIATARRPRS